METLLIDFMNQFGYVAVAAIVFLECAFPPIPSEVVLPAAGAACLTTQMTLPGVIIAATIGATAGATFFYGVGRILSRERLGAFFETRGMRMLGFKRADVERAISWFDRKGQISVLICRCVPVVRSLVSVPAGTARMKLPKFFAYTFIGSALWNTLLCGLGFGAGSAWQTASAQISGATDVATYPIVALCIVAACWWAARRIMPQLRAQEGVAGHWYHDGEGSHRNERSR